MQLPQPPAALLKNASLFLDFDGTLVELAPSPDRVQVENDLRALLNQLNSRLKGRLALLSGRAVADVRSHLHPVSVSVSGSHGLEHWAPGADLICVVERPSGLEKAIEAFRMLETHHPGVLVEEKPLGVALHYRGAPNAEMVCHAAAKQAALETGMTLQFGKMLVELKPASGDKGSALLRFMKQPPFAGTRPIFIGDDVTDEHGFEAARELDGAGVLVGPDRPTAAIYRLEDVSAVRAWLHSASEMLS